MEFNQIYKAPSIPKLSRRTISSPFGGKSSIAAPKLKTTSFSFIKGIREVPSAIFQKSEQDQKERKENKSIVQTLAETNRNLIEILKQLGVDFTSRISQEKKEVDNLKKEKSRKRQEEKKGLFSKLGSGIMGQVTQILAPTKSIFDKIKEFFGIILTGIILNNAFKWLQNPENRKKLAKFFEFVADHWKELLILFGTYKLIRLLAKVIGAAKAIKRLLDFFRRKPPGGGTGGGIPNICNAILNCFGNKATVTSLAQFLLKNAIFVAGVKGLVAAKPQPRTTPRTSPPLTPAPIPAGQPATQPTLAQSLFSTVTKDTKKAFDFKNNPITLPNLNIDSGSMNLGSIGAILSAVLSALTLPGFATERAEGGTIEKPKKKCTACSLGLSNGITTVPGRGGPKEDNVPAWLSVGESVINTMSSMQWRPVIKDLNENAGRLFDQFRQGVISLSDVIGIVKKNTETRAKIDDEFNKYLEQQVRKKQLENLGSGGGNGSVSSKPMTGQAGVMQPLENINQMLKGVSQQPPSSLSQTFIDNQRSYTVKPSANNIQVNINSISKPRNLSQPLKKPNSVIIPMTAPPIMGKMPEISTPTVQSSEVPLISSVNMANPYMQLTSKMYGIYVI